jgi:hypothetical protein
LVKLADRRLCLMFFNCCAWAHMTFVVNSTSP